MKLTRTYFGLSCLYGVSTLFVPFATQLLVNDLALTGLWISTYSFLALIGFGLAAALAIKYFQTMLVEYLQRHLLYSEFTRWKRKVPEAKSGSPYFFELFSMLKSFASLVSDGADLVLKSFFGALALAFIHPAFLVISLLFMLTLFLVRWQGRGAIKASIGESDSKYRMFHASRGADTQGSLDLLASFFHERERHFGFIRRQTLTILSSYFVLQMLLLGWGIRLIQADELSIGQLVSAEIIVSGILVSYAMLPKLLRNFYDFEASYTKLERLQAAGGAA